MKTEQKIKTYSVGLLRGVVDEDGKTRKRGETIKCKSNLMRIITAASRGVNLDADGGKERFDSELAAINADLAGRKKKTA